MSVAEDMSVVSTATNGAGGGGGGVEIDEGLYSRQLYVMGHEAQKRMAASDVLIIGTL